MRDQNKRYGNKNFNGQSRGGDTKPVVVVSDNNTTGVGPGEAIQAKPLEVIVYGNFDKALRSFRSLVQKERVLSAYKERQSYEKPSDKKRRKINESQRKQLEFCSKGECSHPDHSKNRKPKKHKE
jgi:small subunit ribosomal protein S21